jgi:hypothetical protein
MHDDGEEDSNHTLFVTAVRDENVYVNYHSSNIRRRPIFPVSPGDYRYDLYHGDSFIQAVNDSDDYELQKMWVYATSNPAGSP